MDNVKVAKELIKLAKILMADPKNVSVKPHDANSIIITCDKADKDDILSAFDDTDFADYVYFHKDGVVVHVPVVEGNILAIKSILKRYGLMATPARPSPRGPAPIVPGRIRRV